jgi:hypothetical protein
LPRRSRTMTPRRRPHGPCRHRLSNRSGHICRPCKNYAEFFRSSWKQGKNN